MRAAPRSTFSPPKNNDIQATSWADMRVFLPFLLVGVVFHPSTIEGFTSIIKNNPINALDSCLSGIRGSALWQSSGRNDDPKDSVDLSYCLPRRRLLTSVIPFAGVALSYVNQRQVASARGWAQFPVYDLMNTYHFLRAGISRLEEDQDIWSTNPLFLTNREDALSPNGEEQVRRAAHRMRGLDQLPTIVRFSLAARCIDTSDLIGRELNLGRDRLQAEYTFLDPRAIGQWDMLSVTDTEPAVWAMDADEAGADGTGGRPPPNDDGTPHETLADHAVRLRQLFSILESQRSGDTILLVFPDGTGPALLSAMIAGIPYNRAHELEFAPGELRLNVTLESTRALWQSRQGNATYEAILERGRQKLQQLRATDEFVNLKDQRLEAERLEIEQMMREKERRRLLEEQEEAEAKRQLAKQRRPISGDGAAVSPLAWAVAGAGLVGGSAIVGIASSGSPNKLEPLTVNGDGGEGEGEEASLFSETTNGATSSVQKINGDQKGLYPPPPIDPYLAAEKAMQEYLDQDDGGEAWLMSVSQIIDESDDESGE